MHISNNLHNHQCTSNSLKPTLFPNFCRNALHSVNLDVHELTICYQSTLNQAAAKQKWNHWIKWFCFITFIFALCNWTTLPNMSNNIERRTWFWYDTLHPNFLSTPWLVSNVSDKLSYTIGSVYRLTTTGEDCVETLQ